MLDSLRARLLLWYAVILALVIVTFATAVCFVYWRSLVRGIDRDLQANANALSVALRQEISGFFDLDLPSQYRESQFISRSPHTYYAVWDGSGELIDRSDPDVVLPANREPGIRIRDGRRETIIDATSGAVILVSRDLGEAYRDVRGLATTIGGVGASVLLLSLLGGWFLAGRALAPIARISRAASSMAQGDLSARIAVEHTENELEDVARALNEGFNRLGLAADVQRRFTADASHELRTPLATLRAKLDWALSRPRSSTDYVEALETCRRAGERMADTVDELLTLARQDSVAQMRREPVALGDVVQNAVELLQPFASQRKIAVDTTIEPAYVVGDTGRLSEVVANLVKNAIEYNHSGGRVSVKVWSDRLIACVSVQDTGIGIASDELPRIFDRFYRADKARTRKAGGAGLGPRLPSGSSTITAAR
jgi:signal transduction histidine kinase